jgi:hypothetical protein
LRVLVAFEDDYRAYREVIATGIRVLRPSAEVCTINPAGLEVEIKHFEPQVIISTQPEAAADTYDVPAWIELNIDPLLPSKIRVDDCRWESTNPTLDVLFDVFDKVEELI